MSMLETWNQLSRGLRRALIKGSYLALEGPRFAHFLLRCAGDRLTTPKEPLSEMLVRRTVRHLLKETPPPSELGYFREIVERNSLTPWAFPTSFLRLPDSLERRLMGDRALDRHHLARVKLIQEELPRAHRILDIGGAVDVHPEGALLGLGYPYRPAEIDIVDLPIHQREHIKRTPLVDLDLPDGSTVRYHYCGMSHLEKFSDNSFDLVWSGQSIEHVSQEEADKTFEEVFRVLKPGGFFCLDTPNRIITQLISKEYLHPDHHYEYGPQELSKKLEQKGFITRRMLGISPLPRSRRLGRISKLEIIYGSPISDDAESGFAFYIESTKS